MDKEYLKEAARAVEAIIATRKWSLSWHPHTKECRYGWYHNKTLLGGGLWMALNLPILGDFALWKNWEGKTYQR